MINPADRGQARAMWHELLVYAADHLPALLFVEAVRHLGPMVYMPGVGYLVNRASDTIGLDMARYKADMEGHKYKDQIDADAKRGIEVGASGTPTMFINGQKVVGAQPFDAFKKTIDEEMKMTRLIFRNPLAAHRIF